MIVNLGDAPFKAFITVTYPKGNCTVSNGTTTLSHSGSGTHTFTVNKKGTWTVTAQYSTIVKTASVDITYRGQVENVALSYTLLLYDTGTNYTTWLTRGLGSQAYFNNPVAPTVTYGSSTMRIVEGTDSQYQAGIVYTESKIDLTPYTTAYITVNSVSRSHNGARIDFRIQESFGTYQSDGCLTSVSCNTTGTKSLDLTSINQEAYVGMWAYWGVDMQTSKIWLEV